MPPKLAQLRMLDLLVVAVVVVFVSGTLAHAAERGPMRASAVIGLLVAAAILWLITWTLDLLLFPTVRMTRFVLTQALPPSVVVATLFAATSWLLGEPKLASLLGWPALVAMLTPLMATGLFIPERRRQRQPDRAPTAAVAVSS